MLTVRGPRPTGAAGGSAGGGAADRPHHRHRAAGRARRGTRPAAGRLPGAARAVLPRRSEPRGRRRPTRRTGGDGEDTPGTRAEAAGRRARGAGHLGRPRPAGGRRRPPTRRSRTRWRSRRGTPSRSMRSRSRSPARWSGRTASRSRGGGQDDGAGQRAGGEGGGAGVRQDRPRRHLPRHPRPAPAGRPGPATGGGVEGRVRPRLGDPLPGRGRPGVTDADRRRRAGEGPRHRPAREAGAQGDGPRHPPVRRPEWRPEQGVGGVAAGSAASPAAGRQGAVAPDPRRVARERDRRRRRLLRGARGRPRAVARAGGVRHGHRDGRPAGGDGSGVRPEEGRSAGRGPARPGAVRPRLHPRRQAESTGGRDGDRRHDRHAGGRGAGGRHGGRPALGREQWPCDDRRGRQVHPAWGGEGGHAEPVRVRRGEAAVPVLRHHRQRPAGAGRHPGRPEDAPAGCG